MPVALMADILCLFFFLCTPIIIKSPLAFIILDHCSKFQCSSIFLRIRVSNCNLFVIYFQAVFWGHMILSRLLNRHNLKNVVKVSTSFQMRSGKFYLKCTIVFLQNLTLKWHLAALCRDTESLLLQFYYYFFHRSSLRKIRKSLKAKFICF